MSQSPTEHLARLLAVACGFGEIPGGCDLTLYHYYSLAPRLA
jgi:hypothetical protein